MIDYARFFGVCKQHQRKEKHMAKDFAVHFYNSTAWKRCRMAYIKSINGLCERCLKKATAQRIGYSERWA